MNIKRKKKLYALALISTLLITSLTGCKKDNSNSKNNKPSISEEYNDFNEFTKFRIVNGEATQCYKGENIAIAIDKETGEIDEYIYSNSFLTDKRYELRNGTLIYCRMVTNEFGKEYFDNIIENSFIVDFVNIGDYVENETCKEWYTLEEIERLEPLIVSSVEKIEAKVKEKGSSK